MKNWHVWTIYSLVGILSGAFSQSNSLLADGTSDSIQEEIIEAPPIANPIAVREEIAILEEPIAIREEIAILEEPIAIREEIVILEEPIAIREEIEETVVIEEETISPIALQEEIKPSVTAIDKNEVATALKDEITAPLNNNYPENSNVAFWNPWKSEPKEETSVPSTVLEKSKNSRFKGIVLVSCKQEMLGHYQLRELSNSLEPAERNDENGEYKPTSYKHAFVTCKIDNLPGSQKELRNNITKVAYDQPIDKETIAKVQESIFLYYKRHGHPFIDIVVPPQEVTDGILQVIVVETTLYKTEVRGNKFNSCENLLKVMATKPGDVIDINQVSYDVNFLNRNVFQHVDAIYAPGPTPGTTDIILSSEDRFPFRVFVGADNYGLNTTGRTRLLAGFIGSIGWNNIFTYQYMTSPHWNHFQAHTLQYTSLLPWKHELRVFGGYSHVKLRHTPFFIRRNEGNNGQGSIRYTVPLKPIRMINHEATAGFDFKRTNNTLEDSELFIHFSKYVNLAQFVLAYKIDVEDTGWRINNDFELIGSPGKWLPDMNNKDYNTLRPGARNTYIYATDDFHFLYRIQKGFYASLRLRGQLSSQNLLPSEQLGIGGWDTVRGYEQRQLNTDSGIIANVEFRTPSWQVFSRKYTQKYKDGFQALLFCDYGWGANYHRIPGEPKHTYLVGAGPGFRYTFDPILTVRYDIGFKLRNKFQGGDYLQYFSVVLNY